jgi:agmatine/peptidylarginine deiminase
MLSSEIELVEFSINAGWSRDSGPMILVDGILVDGKEGRAVAGFEFNGWGPNFPLTVMMHN